MARTGGEAMNTSTNCPQARQRCPSPWACGEGCNFNNEVPKQSAQERAAVKFWEPDLPVQFVGPEPDEAVDLLAWVDYLPNKWDSLKWWQKVLVACGLIVLCGMVAGILTGIPK
jgi:hypothetical protein